ncbi:MAG: hypothetical protein XD93_0416 [candidate division WS6 bacterium 34_10]|jgi:hypothetical protein|uniref:Uncharacterized protein n=1 Tax=candidate division WS6 bacterium 34_10 TaxID=1641389 RepID=A0A101HI64_9BACT|nr:MAG: hypothetical protein XD93_0416 [candidate division WS6 bacterium 34_10]
MKKLYHGSNLPDLDVIIPNRSGYVHATSELAFALIFSSRERNSLIAKWGMGKNNIPYFCERVRDIFNTLYSGQSSYIYVLDDTNFFQKDKTWRYEYISDKEAKVLDQIVVGDIKEYLLDMQKNGEFQLIRYEDRKKYFPNIDDETVQIVLSIAKKYGKDRAVNDCNKWRPDILEEVKLLLDK